MATSSDTTTTDTADAWSAAMTEWHAAQTDSLLPFQPGQTRQESEDQTAAAADREDASARIIFNIPAPSLPALLHKIAVYRALYTSTGNCFPPEDHRDLVAPASIEADVATLIRTAGAR